MTSKDAHSPGGGTFRILAGDFEFQIIRNGKPVRLAAAPGTTVHVPGGEPHLFRNVGASVGRLQIVLCPGDFEGYFFALGKPVQARFTVVSQSAPPDVQQFLAAGKQYGVEFFDA